MPRTAFHCRDWCSPTHGWIMRFSLWGNFYKADGENPDSKAVNGRRGTGDQGQAEKSHIWMLNTGDAKSEVVSTLETHHQLRILLSPGIIFYKMGVIIPIPHHWEAPCLQLLWTNLPRQGGSQHRMMGNALGAMIRAAQENSPLWEPSLGLIYLNINCIIRIESQNPCTYTYKGKMNTFSMVLSLVEHLFCTRCWECKEKQRVLSIHSNGER